MIELWQRIENWLRANAPAIAQGLNPPATMAEIQSTEKSLGIAFPEDVKQSYLLHNGQSQESPPMLEGWEWLSLERMRDEWTVWNDLLQSGDFEGLESETDGQQIVTDWWHPKWIPLTYSGAGDHHCLDLNPGPQGKAGQIIEMWHDDGERPWIAASFCEWISNFADELERGDYVLSEEYGSLCRVEDLE